MTAIKITEARAVILEGKGLDRKIRIITPGMGSSGFYATEVLKEAVKDTIFDTGLHLYVDHPTMTEDADRPERSVRDLAAVGVGPAVWNEAAQAVDQPIKIFEHYKWLGDVSESIGMSIRCSAEVSEGEIEGKPVRVIDKLTEAYSVDFVTKAGRGGKILEAMEAARPKIDIGEALSGQRRDALSKAARDKYQATDQRWVYVTDFDETAKFAIISINDRMGDESKLIKESYTVGQDDLSVSLSGDAIEVQRAISYVPVASQATESQKGQPMPEITEAELKERDDKIVAAEARAKAAEDRAAELEAKESERTRNESAAKRVAEKIGKRLDHLDPAVKSRVTREALRAVPVKEGKLDEPELDQRVEEAIKDELAYLKSITPTGVVGHGSTGSLADGDEKASEAAIKRIPFAGRNN